MNKSLQRLKDLMTGRAPSSVEILPDGTIRPSSPAQVTTPGETDTTDAPALPPAPAANPTKLAPRTFGAVLVSVNLRHLNLSRGRLG